MNTKHITIDKTPSPSIENVSYSVGDVFRFAETGDYYVINKTGIMRVQLTNIHTFNNWSEVIFVDDIENITEEEFNNMVPYSYRNSFVRIKEVRYEFVH